MVTVNIRARDPKTNVHTLRKDGFIPAVYYGRVQKSTPISMRFLDFEKAWREAGESTVVTLKNEKGDSLDALIHDVDVDPLKNAPRHADFYVFEEGKTIEVSVPLEFVGVAPAIKEKGGVLVKVMHELSIEAMPRALPNVIEVDISSLLDFDSQILAQDVALPDGVVLKEDGEEVVASIYEPQEEPEEETDAAAVDFSSIEVEKRGKEDSGDESGEGASTEKESS